MVDEAVAWVNLLLAPEVNLRLEVWDFESLRPSAIRKANNQSIVPVVMIEAPSDKVGMVAAVPRGLPIILVEDAALPELERIFSNGFEDGLDVAASEILAICLLHETGHIHHGHYKRATVPPKLGFNVHQTRAKALEDEADAFAADRIRRGISGNSDGEFGGAATSRLLTAGNLAMALSKVSWNLMGSRILDNFGSTSLRRTEVLGDPSTTHHNLELRFLRLNFLVSPSDDSRVLLEDFHAMREDLTRPPQPLWERSIEVEDP